MKDIKNVLLAKSGYATTKIAVEFLNLEKGNRIKTVSELEKIYHFSHGTIQNALKALKDLDAIETVSKGKQGTILTNKNDAILLAIIGIKTIVGCMPLPYSKRYEGLATGLISCIEEKTGVSSNVVFSRGASARTQMVENGRCDYIITSKLAGRNITKNHPNLEIIKEFGPGSYLSDHVLIFHNNDDKDIKDGMKIGIDNGSYDQCNLVKLVCANKKVKYIDVSYPNLLKRIMSGDIDATVWNKDEIFDKYLDVSYRRIEKDDSDTNAVMIVRKDRKELISFLNKYIDIEYINKKAKLVIEGLVIPKY